MKRYCVAAVAALSIAAAAGPGTAEAAVCVPAAGICVTGIEENIADTVATAQATKAAVDRAVDQAVFTALETYVKTYFAVAEKTGPVGDSVFNAAGNPAPICAPAPVGRPICVTGVGAAVGGVETKLCTPATYPEPSGPVTGTASLTVFVLNSLAGACRTTTA